MNKKEETASQYYSGFRLALCYQKDAPADAGMPPQAANRKKLVVSKSALKARVYKGLADANEAFCGKGAMTERVSLSGGKSNAPPENERSVVYCDVVELRGFEPLTSTMRT